MTKKLIIAEKPSVAGEIAKALGGFKKSGECYERDDLVVAWAVGHLVRSNAPADMLDTRGIESLPIIPPRFVLEVPKESAAPYKNLQSLMKRGDVSTIVNACDAGREGELIFRLIYEKAECRKPMERMWLRTMTSTGIVEAYQDLLPGSQFDHLADAAKSRSEADWIVGINASRALTHLVSAQRGTWTPTNAGRVQTPTVALVVHREREILNFVPRDYWEVHATITLASGQHYVSKWTRQEKAEGLPATQINTLDEANAISGRCRDQATTQIVDDAKATKKNAPSLYDLTTLQREANRRFGFSAKKTLDVAQRLYEKHKSTTYPRTDASALPEDYVEKAAEALSSLTSYSGVGLHAKRVLDSGWCKPNKAIFNNDKISDHFAIIPTGIALGHDADADEQKIFDLIVKRFVAVFHPAAEFLVTTRTTTVAQDVFRSSGTVMVSEGWMAVYGQSNDDDDETSEGGLCPLVAGEQGRVSDIKSVGLKTKPPKRYTEDTLLSAMESAGKVVDDEDAREAMKKKGLGTPATRAGIIENVVSTKGANGKTKVPFLERSKVGKTYEFVPTEKAMTLIDDCEKNNLESITSPLMTGEWELKLLEIERGKLERSSFMAAIAQQMQSFINDVRGLMGSVPTVAREGVDAPCPKCGSALEASPKAVSCTAKCGFYLGTTVASKTLTSEQIKTLLTTKRLGPLDGFVSTKGSAFSATLVLDPETAKANFEFEERAPVALNTIEGQCPKCQSPVALSAGKWPAVTCTKSCGFKFSTTVAERTLSPKEIQTLLTTKRLPSTHGFVSRAGKKFTAALKFKADFTGIDFDFENN